MYRRTNPRQRRYGYQDQAVNQNEGMSNQNAEFETLKRIGDIPLPNELESPAEFPSEFRNSGIPSLINFFKTRIHIEEIIIIGLILLLLDEGINCLEDEFLLIMLVYILIT